MLEMLASVFLANNSPMKSMQFTMPGQSGWSGGEEGGRQGMLTPLSPTEMAFQKQATVNKWSSMIQY